MTLFYFNALHMDDGDEAWTVGVHMYPPLHALPLHALPSGSSSRAAQPSLEHTPVPHCCLLFRAAGL